MGGPEKQSGGKPVSVDQIDDMRIDVSKAINQHEADLRGTIDERLNESTTGEIALNELKNKFDAEEGPVRRIFQGYRKRVQTGFRHELEKIKEESGNFSRSTRAIIEKIAGKDGIKTLSPEEIHELMGTLEGVEKFARNDEGVAVLKKIQHERPLTDVDYEVIAHHFHLEGLKDQNPAGKDRFEQTTAGLMLTLMNPPQRMEFVRFLMKNPGYQKEVHGALNNLMMMGILTVPQGENLFQEAFQTYHAITAEQYYAAMNNWKEGGQKLAERQKFIGKIKSEVAVLEGSYAINPLERFAGFQGLGVLAEYYGIIGIVSNAMIAKLDVPEMMGNPWFLAAIGTTMAGYGMRNYGGKVGASMGGIGSMFDDMVDSEVPEKPTQRNNYESMKNLHEKSTDFNKYLANGGAQAILNIRSRHDLTNHAPVTFDDLVAEAKKQKNPDQVKFLEAVRLQHHSKGIIYFDSMIRDFLTICVDMNINNQDKYDRVIANYEKSQGIHRPATNTPSH